MPRVSIIISHYDRQTLLLEALESIASQTFRDFEAIVVNDHGVDSAAIVEAFKQRATHGTSPFDVRYDYRPVNSGVAATRNRGVALARGALIAYLDDDDLWSPDHLMGLVAALDAHPECDLAYGDAEICRMERTSSEAGADASRPWRRAESRLLAVPFDLDELRCDDFIVPGAMVHRRSLYDAVGPFDESLYVSDDWDWLLRASALTRFVRVPRIVVTVRMWPDRGNLSADFGTRRLAALAQIQRRHGTPPLEPKTFWEVAEKHLPAPGARSPEGLLELAAAYQRSRVLWAMVDLDVAATLAGGARSIGDINGRLGADPVALERFLDACVALGLLAREGGAYANSAETQRYLVRGAPAYLGDALVRDDRVSRLPEWTEFARRLRSWRSGSASPPSMQFAPSGPELDGQHRLALLAGEALGRAMDWSTCRRLLDCGGGTGAMSIALCRRYPELEAIVLERPAMIASAGTYVRESGLERIVVREGDFVSGPLPAGCDVALLANVLSMSSAETNRDLIARLYDYLPPDGTLVLSGWMLDEHGTGPMLSLLFSMEDVALRAPDVERSTTEYADWLASAGFERIESHCYFPPLRYVVGRRPSSRNEPSSTR